MKRREPVLYRHSSVIPTLGEDALVLRPDRPQELCRFRQKRSMRRVREGYSVQAHRESPSNGVEKMPSANAIESDVASYHSQTGDQPRPTGHLSEIEWNGDALPALDGAGSHNVRLHTEHAIFDLQSEVVWLESNRDF